MGNTGIVGQRLIIRKERCAFVEAVDTGIFGPDPDIPELICTDIPDYFSFHGVRTIARIIDLKGLERRIIIDAVLVETNPDSVFPIAAESGDILTRQGIRITRILLYPAAFACIGLINDKSGIRSDPKLVFFLFHQTVDEKRQLVGFLNM